MDPIQPEKTYVKPEELEDIVIIEEDDLEFESPVPYVESMSPEGVLTIGWDLPMTIVDNPLIIPATRVAVKAELLETEEEKALREAEELLA